MINIFLPHHIEFLTIINRHEVEYLLIGGMAVNIYGYNRTTGDVDLFVNGASSNRQKLVIAIDEYGYDATELLEKEEGEMSIFSLGSRNEIGHIEIMNQIAGITFNEAYKNIQFVDFEGMKIKCIHISDLIKNKRASGRMRDLDDVEKLSKLWCL